MAQLVCLLFFLLLLLLSEPENKASIDTAVMERKGLSCSSGLKIKIKTT